MSLEILAELADQRLCRGEKFVVPEEWLESFTPKEKKIIAGLGESASHYFKNSKMIKYLDEVHGIYLEFGNEAVITRNEFFLVEDEYIQYFVAQMLLRYVSN